MLKKGFTLIELLAVIIILAIVALIATPIILNVIEDARISAGRSEASMIYTGIYNYCATEDMKYQLDNSYNKICTTSMNTDTVSQMVNLGNASITSISYDGTKLTNLIIESNSHTFTLCGDGTFAMDDEECGVAPEDPDVGLVGDTISDTVLTQFPYLATTGNGCTTPGDNNYSYMGGCYLKDYPTDNYIWYSGFLWRIMGINADGTIRMMTNETVTFIPWGTSGTGLDYDGSHVKEWLNNYFYNNLKGNDVITNQVWCSEVTTSSTSARTTCTTNLSTTPAKVGLMSIDEYNLAGGTNSYLDLNQNQWTLTPYSSTVTWYSYGSSGNASGIDPINAYGVSPVINVASDTIITGGDGSLTTNWSKETGPYILNEDKNVEITGNLTDYATSGEYVIYAGKKYRVVDIDNSGNTKLILDGYYDESIATVFGSNNTFSTTAGIGKTLNETVLNWLVASSNTIDRDKLVTNYNWYQTNFALGNNYKISLEETNPTRNINATVGLIRIGEMLSGYSSSIITNNYTENNSFLAYWTLTPHTDTSKQWSINSASAVDSNTVSAMKMRPVIVIKADVTINGGNGTWYNPYQI